MKSIQKYLNGTPASYSTKDGKIIAWDSEKPKPTKAQLAQLEKEIKAEEKVKEDKKIKRYKIVKALGETIVEEALIKQINELREALISGDNKGIIVTDNLISNLK